MEIIPFFSWLGEASITYFWKPIVIWTMGAIPLFHELIHVRRNDYIKGIILRFLSALLVYHPFILVLESQAQKKYRKLSCDNEMLDTIG